MTMRWCETCQRPRPLPGAPCPGCGRGPEPAGATTIVGPAATVAGAAAAPPTGPPAAWPAPPPVAGDQPPAALPLGVGPPTAPPPWVGTGPSGGRRRRGSKGRRTRSPLAALLSIALAIGGWFGGQALFDARIDDILHRDMRSTSSVDEPDERVAVYSPVGEGVRWTMQEEPEQDQRSVPTPAGSMSVRMWLTTHGDSGEFVGVYDIAGGSFDLDLGLQGAVDAVDGDLGTVATTRVDGRAARTAPFEARIDDVDVTGRVTVVGADDVAVLAMMLGPEDDAEAVRDQQQILVDSLRIG